MFCVMVGLFNMIRFSGHCILLRITYLKTESPHLVGRATPVLSLSKRPDAAGKARPTVNHLTVMNYVKLNKSSVRPEPVEGLAVPIDCYRFNPIMVRQAHHERIKSAFP